MSHVVPCVSNYLSICELSDAPVTFAEDVLYTGATGNERAQHSEHYLIKMPLKMSHLLHIYFPCRKLVGKMKYEIPLRPNKTRVFGAGCFKTLPTHGNMLLKGEDIPTVRFIFRDLSKELNSSIWLEKVLSTSTSGGLPNCEEHKMWLWTNSHHSYERQHRMSPWWKAVINPSYRLMTEI